MSRTSMIALMSWNFMAWACAFSSDRWLTPKNWLSPNNTRSMIKSFRLGGSRQVAHPTALQGARHACQSRSRPGHDLCPRGHADPSVGILHHRIGNQIGVHGGAEGAARIGSSRLDRLDEVIY